MGGSVTQAAAPGFLLGGPGGAAAAGALIGGMQGGAPGAAKGALLGYGGGQLMSSFTPGSTMIPSPEGSGMMLNLPEGVKTAPSIDWQAAGQGLMGIAPMLMEPRQPSPQAPPYQPRPTRSALQAYRGY